MKAKHTIDFFWRIFQFFTMPKTIYVEFDIWQEITARRISEHDTEADVIRRALQMPPRPKAPPELCDAWRQEGVELPHGTKLLLTYKGQEYHAEIVDGVWTQNGEPQSTPSRAANVAT